MSESAGNSSAAAASSQGNGEGAQGQQSAQTTQTQGAAQGGETSGDVTGEQAVEASFEKTENTEDEYVPMRDYIRKQYADEQLEDDDKVDRKAYKHVRELESYRDKNRDANKRIMQIFTAHPQLVGVLQDMDAGADFSEAIALNLDPEQRKTFRESILSDDYKPQQETWQTKKQEREAKYQEKVKWQDTYSKNRKEASDNLTKFATEKQLDQEGMTKLAEYADNMLKDVWEGKVSPAFLNMVFTAMNAPADIAKAAQVAEVKGRNAAITEKVAKAKPEGDGLPDLGKGAEVKKTDMPEGAKMLSDLVDGFNNRRKQF